MADGYCNYCLNRGFCENACADYNDYLADMGKLRLYEQTGLTPTEVAEIAQPELIAGLDKLAEYESSGLRPDECRALGDAKCEGRLVVLPCRVGDVVYWVSPLCTGVNHGNVVTVKISSFGFDLEILRNDNIVRREYEKVFLSRAEAENHLRERGE